MFRVRGDHIAALSKAAQIKRVAEFLDDPTNDERSVEDVAKRIVEGFYDGWGAGVWDALPHPKVGLAYRTPLTSKVYHVCWIGDGKVWLCDSSGGPGWLVKEDDRFWLTCTLSKSKPLDLTNKDGWKADDRLSTGQRRTNFVAVATNSSGALLRDLDSLSLWSESNSDLKRFYKKESADSGLFD